MTNAFEPVLVTGAAGLIGSAVVRVLAACGTPVVACDDFSLGTTRVDAPGITWESYDVADPSFADALSAHAPRAIVHAAAHPGGRSLREPSLDVRVNALGSMHVFEWCARASVPVVYLSSSAVYGEQPPVPITESAPLAPGTVYAACKVACESFLRVLGDGYGLSWTVLRLFATYGAEHRPGVEQGIVNIMLTQLLAGDTVVVRGSLARVRDLLFVADAALAIVACLDEPRTRGRVFNMGTGQGITVRDLITTLAQLLGRAPASVQIVEAEPTVGDPQWSVADARALARATGFVPRWDVRSGLAEVVRARRASLELSPR